LPEFLLYIFWAIFSQTRLVTLGPFSPKVDASKMHKPVYPIFKDPPSCMYNKAGMHGYFYLETS
jgi:hypothetical protein